MYKVYIDGSSGTTGLQIFDRFKNRTDVTVLKISDELRKDKDERKRLINSSDITFLCLPDEASIEAVSLLDNNHTKIIDASTAHRTLDNWAYGLPELGDHFKQKIKNSNFVAVPGCYASGFSTIVYPIVSSKVINNDYPIVCSAISGYSGGGVKTIAKYEDINKEKDLFSPRVYATKQMHKHLKEMKHISNLSDNPIFFPYISDYYSGMIVSIGLYTKFMNKYKSVEELHKFYSYYYKDSKLINVMPLEDFDYIPANGLSGVDYLNLYITGNSERIMITAQFDNLGKGASGAAVLCMNIMLGLEETTGLNL